MKTCLYSHATTGLPRLPKCERREAKKPARRHRWPNKQRLQVNQSGAHLTRLCVAVNISGTDDLEALLVGVLARVGICTVFKAVMNETRVSLVACEVLLVFLFPHSMSVLYFLVKLMQTFKKFFGKICMHLLRKTCKIW